MKNTLKPQDIEMEKALLGAILLFPIALDEIKQIGLTKKDFYSDSNALIFEACETLKNNDKVINALTVRSELERTKNLEAAGGAFAIISLTTDVNASHSVLEHAAKIKELGLKRELHDFTSIMYQKTADPSTDIFELLDAFKAISQNNILDTSLQPMTAREAAFKSLKEGNEKRLERIRNGMTGITGVATFSKELDYITQGRHRKKLDVIGAPTGNGKSLVMVADAYKAAKAGVKTVIISLEMGVEELADRFMSIESGITYSRITKQLYSDREFDLLLEHHTVVQDALENVILYNVSSLDIRKVENIIYKHKDEAHTFYIDYIQLVKLNNKLQKNEGLGIYTKDLKLFSMKYNVNITVLAQLNRLVLDVKTKEDLHERYIADSKQIADDADSILLMMVYEKFGITSDELGNPTTEDYKHLVGFNLTKNRGGQTHTMDMWVDLGKAQYEDNPVSLKVIEDQHKQIFEARI